ARGGREAFILAPGSPPHATTSPAIVLQPSAANLFKGDTAVLYVLATGSIPLSYQWQKDGAPIGGPSGSSLILTNIQPGDSGNYSVLVSNGAGSATSDVATLAVTDATKPVITQQPRPA